MHRGAPWVAPLVRTALDERDVGFRSLTRAVDTTATGGTPVFDAFGALAK
jgi:hypothetical protein